MRITFMLLAYNQEDYVAEAVRAVLGQVGEPIRILISDDASTDKTFEVIAAVVAGYVGHHEVELNRNPHNLGLAAHINACMARITTDYVIAAAADDISLPERAMRVQVAFDRTQALLLHSSFEAIDTTGKPLVDSLRFEAWDMSARGSATRMTLHVGATAAWHRALFDHYGGIDEGCYEDLILGFRAALERRVSFIDEVLVRYRVDVGMTARERVPAQPEDWLRRRREVLSRMQSVFTQRLREAAMSSHPDRAAIVRQLAQVLRLTALRLQCCDQPPLSVLQGNLSHPLLAVRAVFSEQRRRMKVQRKGNRLG